MYLYKYSITKENKTATEEAKEVEERILFINVNGLETEGKRRPLADSVIT